MKSTKPITNNPEYRPKEIRIAGKRFKIVYEISEDFGRFDYEKQIVFIRENLSQREIFQTLIHESFHIALWVSGVSFAIDSERIEEALIRCFDNFLLSVIEEQLKALNKLGV
jgi:Zn-dependent peptidase ImmA (M78 family)